MCCGEPMQLMNPNTTDAANEKHVPAVTLDGKDVYVKVGEVTHPMMAAHYIEWIVLRTTLGNQRKALTPEDAPEARFALLDGEEIISALAYCNLHGLWEGVPEK